MDSGELKLRFGKRVQRLREAAGLTQEALAERIGRSVDTVGNIERGINATRIEIAYLLAINLGVTLPELFDLGGAAGVADRSHSPQREALMTLIAAIDEQTIAPLTALVEAGLRLAGRGASADH